MPPGAAHPRRAHINEAMGDERAGAHLQAGEAVALVEALEVCDLAVIERALGNVRGLDHSRVIGLQVEAMRWADTIGEPG